MSDPSDWKIISAERLPAMKTPDNRQKMPKGMRKYFDKMLAEFPEAKNHPPFIRMLKTWKGY